MREIDMIALAGLLHDIGKFGQRAKLQLNEPFKKNRYGHRHANYTAQILHDNFEDIQNYHQSAYEHHIVNKNSEENSWVLAAADRLASGFERECFNDYNENAEKEVNEDYDNQQMTHLFSDEKSLQKFPLSSLTPQNIFSDFVNQDGYEQLWNYFTNDLKKISEKEHFPFTIKIDSLDYLLKKYTSFIPSATNFKSKYSNCMHIANIPLYEHSKITAMFASTIFSMRSENRESIISYYRDKNDKALENKFFLLVNGDFFGIQNFIFDEVQSKYASKTLRAKSAFVQLLTKVLAFYVIEELGLSKFNVISTHAGKFEILAPNEDSIKDKLKSIQRKFNDYFIKEFFAETGVGLTWNEASIETFIDDKKYKEFRKDLADKVEETKYQKFDLKTVGHYIFEVDENLTNANLCNFCHKRKGSKERGNIICKNCKRYVTIGEQLAKSTYLAISKNKKSDDDIEIFEGFYLHFFENPSQKLAKDDVYIFDISKDDEFSGFPKWELRSYVAKLDSLSEVEISYLHSKDKNNEGLSEILTFENLAYLSVKDGIIEHQRKEGVEAIMALKGDGDGMGEFIKTSDVTNSFAKYNFFARMIDYYFSVYVPQVLMQCKSLYTVFAGGDDLFVLGAWDEVIELAQKVRDDFVRFTHNKLSFSIGMVMSKPNKPINFLSDSAEKSLEDAKGFCCKKENGTCIEIIKDKRIANPIQKFPTVIKVQDKYRFCQTEDMQNLSKKDAINIFKETVSWENYELIKEKFSKSFKHPKGEEFTSAFLYQLLKLCSLSKKVKYYEKDSIQATIWKSKLVYLYRRNISNQDSEQDLLRFLGKIMEAYPKELKVVLDEYIYKRRKA